MFHQDRVTRYLREYESLSRQARIRLFANIHSDLGEYGDYYRNDDTRRLVPGSDFFWYQLLLLDADGDGRIRQFSFVVNDEPAKYGVLLIEFVEIDEGTKPLDLN